MQPESADCRVYERHNCQVATSCAPAAANEQRWDATIEDISKSGIRLRLPRRFEPRTGLAIELPGKDGQEPYTVYVKVVHVRKEDDGTWALGCRLMSELSEDELDRLMSLNPSRFTVVPQVRLRIGIPERRVVHCRVKRFHVVGAWPLPAGKTLTVRGVAKDGSRLDHDFEVVECRQEGDGWTLDVAPVDAAASPAWLHALGRHEQN